MHTCPLVIPDTTCIDLSGGTVCYILYLEQARDVTVTKSAITRVFVLAALEALRLPCLVKEGLHLSISITVAISADTHVVYYIVPQRNICRDL